MDIRQLRYFLKVAETLNFSEASRRLFITQSTLSQQISHLEQEIGLSLFERNSHEVFLTGAGKELLPYAQRAVVATESCMDHIQDLKQILTGELNIGVTYSFSTIMSETLVDFMKTYPGVKLNIDYRTMEELMTMLKRRELDFVLAFRPLKKDKDIESHVIFANRVAALVKEDHPLNKEKTVNLEQLQRYDLVLPARGLQARNAFDKLVADRDLNFNIKVEVNHVDIILALLHRTHYVSVLSESTVLHEEGLRAIPIAEADNKMEGCIHMLKDSYVKHAAQAFIRMLTESTTVYTRALSLSPLAATPKGEGV